MRIIGIHAENFQKLKVFSLEPKGNVIKITGANASGKTSALDVISLALLGARGGPTAPVRRGAERGMVKLDLGEFWVTRQWAEGADPKGEMWIEAKDGKRYGTPQKVLDAVMSKITFDPLAFTRMKPNEQADEVRKLLDLDEPLTALRVRYDEDYATRTGEARELKQMEAQRAGILFPADLPKQRRDIDAMVVELGAVSNFNMDIERERMKREQAERVAEQDRQIIVTKMQRIEELQGEIERLQGELKEDVRVMNKNRDEINAWKPLPEAKDAQAISENINAARAVNASIEQRDKAERMDAEITAKREVVARLNRAIDDNRQQALDLIAAAKYPVPGLGFTEGEVTFNDLPFTQASNAEQIKVSIAMGMMGNAKLRVMRIKDGSLLDEESMAVVEDMAEKNDYQVFIEIVDTSGEVGVYLVDGEIAAIDGKPVGEAPKPTLRAARKKPVKAEKQESLEL